MSLDPTPMERVQVRHARDAASALSVVVLSALALFLSLLFVLQGFEAAVKWTLFYLVFVACMSGLALLLQLFPPKSKESDDK